MLQLDIQKLRSVILIPYPYQDDSGIKTVATVWYSNDSTPSYTYNDGDSVKENATWIGNFLTWHGLTYTVEYHADSTVIVVNRLSLTS